MTRVTLTVILDDVFATEEELFEISDEDIVEIAKEDLISFLENAKWKIERDVSDLS